MAMQFVSKVGATAATNPAAAFNASMTEFKHSCTQVIEANAQFKSVADGLALVKNGCFDEAKQNAACSPTLEGLAANNPKYSKLDVVSALEGTLEDYAKKVVDYAASMISHIKNYATNLQALFTRKLRTIKSIDFRKFAGVDTSMRMVIMTYGDYMELHMMCQRADKYAFEMDTLQTELGKLSKNLADGTDTADQIKAIRDFLVEGNLATELRTASLTDFSFDEENSETAAVTGVTDSARFKSLEESRTLSAAGWNFERVIDAIRYYNSDYSVTHYNSMYSKLVDFIEECRRISSLYCVKQPTVCAMLTVFSTVLAKQINIYTRVFDMTWNTAIKLVPACYSENA